jgi:hypothetical protein
MIKTHLAVESWERQAGVDEEKIVMIIRAIAARIDAEAALDIGGAKLHAVSHESERLLEIEHVENDVIDDLWASAKAPAPMPVQAINGVGRIQRVRSGDYGFFVKDSQGKRQPAVGQEMDRAIGIPLQVTIASKVGGQAFQVFRKIDPPHYFAHPRAFEGGVEKCGIIAVTKYDLRALLQLEDADSFGARDERQPEVFEELRAHRNVVNAVNQAFDA